MVPMGVIRTAMEERQSFESLKKVVFEKIGGAAKILASASSVNRSPFRRDKPWGGENLYPMSADLSHPGH